MSEWFSEFWWHHGDSVKLVASVVAIAVLITVLCFGFFVVAATISCNELRQVDPMHEYKVFHWSGVCRVRSPNGYWINQGEAHLLEFDE